MTRITFLHGVRDRALAAAQWLAHPEQGNTQVAVYVPDDRDRAHLDRMLWESPATGFLPHCNAAKSIATETPIVLATQLSEVPNHACVLNLSNVVPEGFERFERLIEIISRDDADRLPGRERFRFYREHGYMIESTDMSSGQTS